MGVDLVPVEEAVEGLVLQTGNCVCLPTRYEARGLSHPYAIRNSLIGERKDTSWVFLGGSGGLGCKGVIP
eukprot:13572592-Ditylum_brightwellii.AAC.1